MDENDKKQQKNRGETQEIQENIENPEEEIVMEDGEGNTATQKDVLKNLREKLKKALEEKQDYLDKWQRAQAEFINARKRDQDAKQEFLKFAKEDVLSELVPVLESFEMAQSNKESWEKVDQNWRKGVEYIHSQLVKVLENHGLSIIDSTGQTFDPTRDEAISYEPVNDPKLDHTVVEVIQKGYGLGGKILKAPRVKVGEHKGEHKNDN